MLLGGAGRGMLCMRKHDGRAMGYISNWPTIGILFLGILLIGVGFSLRSRSYGVFLLWAGQALMVGLIVFHILKAVSQ